MPVKTFGFFFSFFCTFFLFLGLGIKPTITCDNGSNLIKACSEGGFELSLGMCHNIALALKWVFKQNKPAKEPLEACKSLVSLVQATDCFF